MEPTPEPLDQIPVDETGKPNPDRYTVTTELTPEPLLRFFEYAHLPERLQAYSKPFAELAGFISTLPRNAERTVALRKLLEAKDCAIRAVL